MFKIRFQILDFLSVFKVRKMSINLLNDNVCKTYEESIRTLNGLISNSTTIAKSIEKGAEIRLQHIPRTKKFCERAGVYLTDLNNLKIVHIAGTKGKGSTSTYIDAILHQNGYKTGLFTSPHLMEVRERIKINGSSISKSDFSRYFWHIYDQLNTSKTSSEDMPFYFQFLTIMAFHVFLKEKVDYVILETGIGGRFDSTNIIQSSKIACITSLGFDHMEILGNTLKEIGWNKAGIIKPGSLVVICDNQPEEGLESILAEVELHRNQLFLVPVKGQFFTKDRRNIHPENASLASAVCHLLLNDRESPVNHITDGPETNTRISNIVDFPLKYSRQSEFRNIIHSTTVRGRYQTIKKGNIDYFIDGAHTMESMMTCVRWFQEVSADKKYSYRFLIFMITGQRSVENLLSQLTILKFDKILLAPLVPFINNQPPDFATDDAIIGRERAKLSEIEATWHRLNGRIGGTEESVGYFNCFQDMDNWLSRLDSEVQVLVVGSLHLVGCALAVLDPTHHS